jgi:hypothetical protein
MGNFLGNLIGLCLILVAAVVSLFTLKVGVAVAAGIAYLVFVIVLVFERFGRVKPELRAYQMLRRGILPTEEEIAAFGRYHTFVNFPAAGQAMSALLNSLRLAGIVWAIFAFWNGYWWSGVANAGCFFVFGGACLRLDPIQYLRTAAQSGQAYALQQLEIIMSLREATEAWLARHHDQEASSPSDEPKDTSLP